MRLVIDSNGRCATAVLRLLAILPYTLVTIPVAATPAQESFKRFGLLIVDPDNQPVPHATVEVRGRPKIDGERIVEGSFIRQQPYGTLLSASENGRVTLDLLPNARPTFSIKAKGFGPYWAEWRNDPLPEKLTAELDRARVVGGVVVDEQGQPIAGAKVQPSLQHKKRPGDTHSLGVGTRIETDDQGKWTYDYLPTDLKSFTVEVTHGAFKSTVTSLSSELFSLSDNTVPSARIVMEKGLVVRGKVTDSSGKPVASALLRTKYLNDIREARTNADGEYELGGCESSVAKIVVSAKKLATDMQVVQISEGMDSVNFEMQPGGHVRIRVVDEKDNPIPKARIFFQGWRGDFDYFEFDHVGQYADENGVWDWNEAPLDEFKADICRPGGMELGEQSLIAREDEYVFAPPPALVIVGRVLDAATKEPVEEFEVVPGVRSNPQRMNWVPSEIFKGSDGKFEYQRTHDYFAHLFKVQAKGYLAKESRDIKSNEGRVEITFELERGTNVDMRVMTPDGTPAVGAKVALGIPGAQIDVSNGDIDNGSTYAERQTVNKAGRFRFPPQSTPYQLVITHESGFAHLDSEKLERKDLVRLTPWARIQGVFQLEGKPIEGVKLYSNSGNLHASGDDSPNIFSSSYIVTGKDGHFSLDRVFPGRGCISRNILRMVGEGAKEVTSSTSIFANFVAGETTVVNFGGAGAKVRGRLLPPADFEGKVLWSFANLDVESNLGPGPIPVPDELKDQPAQQAEWYEKWITTDDGKNWHAKAQKAEEVLRDLPRYSATVDKDGSFNIYDIPAGDYQLSVRFWEKPAGQLRNYDFTVDQTSATERNVVDLGDLQLEN
jgi:protocatechuate 3,4-dioxygenase beta subunit